MPLVLLVSFVLGTFCQVGGLPPTEAPEPVTYRFVRQAEPLGLFVEIVVPGGDRELTELVIEPHWGPVEKTTDSLADFTAHDADGQALEVTREAETSWTVSHEPGDEVTLRYRLVDGGPVGFRNRYKPVVRESHFEIIGHVALVRPAHCQLEVARPITIEWQGFEEEGWSAVCSWGTGFGPLQLEKPLREALRAIYLAGDLEVARREVPGGELVVARTKGEWRFTVDRLADVAQGIVRAQREFFRDDTDPYYLITMSPFEERGGMGGTGLDVSFASFLHPDFDLDEGSDSARRIEVLLAHELFHHWNGGEIRLDQPEQLGYWFSEGFTDFYARAILRQAELMSDAERLDSLNELLLELWRNPEREAPNARIRDAFWTVRDVQRLPYLRGHLIAWLLDHHLRRASGGDRSLDEWMRAVWKETLAEDRRVETDWLLSRIERDAGEEMRARLERILIDGRLPDLPDDLGGEGTRLTWKEQPSFDLGFDFERSQEERRVCALDAGSAAEDAGLREGQPLTSWSVHWGDIDRDVIMVVTGEDGTAEEIRYRPRSKEMLKIPVYVR